MKIASQKNVHQCCRTRRGLFELDNEGIMRWVVNKKEKNHESLILNRLADHKKLKDIKA